MKICVKCKTSKEESEFSFKNKTDNIRHSICKECHRNYASNDYKKKTQYYIDKAKKHNQVVKKRNKELLLEYLSKHPCVDCGNDDIRILTFDHVRGKKKQDVSGMMNNSWQTIENEISKCEVRCWNCHILRHVVKNGWRYNFADVV